MRSGLLTEILVIKQEQSTTSPSGAVKKEWIETHRIKANKRKLSASIGSGISANEEFIANTLVFQARVYSFLSENIRVGYQGKEWKVILLDKQLDNSYLMTLSKINK